MLARTSPPGRVAFLQLSRDLGREEPHPAILGAGSTATRLADDTVMVKSRGSFPAAIDEARFAGRTDPTAQKTCVEPVLNACPLTLPGVTFVGHTHPVAVNQLPCSNPVPAGTPRFLPAAPVDRIAGRPDEPHRQQALGR